jgi:hypothetical protein
MEHRLAKKINFVFISLAFLFYGCGYFENDSIDYKKEIVGNIKVLKQENTTLNNLVFQESEEMFAVILYNCKSVYYDSIHKKIYVESFLVNSDPKYYQVEITNPTSKYMADGVEKKIVSKKTFYEHLKKFKKSDNRVSLKIQ